MPIYGYRCQACEQEFEVTQRMSDPAVAACPACGGTGTRLFFPAGIVFKGSGFYKTDSRSPSKAASAGDGGVAATKTDSSSSNGASTPAKEGGATPTPAPASSSPSTPAPTSKPSAPSTPTTTNH